MKYHTFEYICEKMRSIHFTSEKLNEEEEEGEEEKEKEEKIQ